MNTDDTDRKNAEEKLPRMDADERGSGPGEQTLPRINTDQTDLEGVGKMLPQPAGGEVYANRGVNSEVHANLG
jgi:hypothetical protein